MPLEGKEIVPRILRDMNEGVLVLDTRGVILYLNEKGRELLGKAENPEGEKYSLALMAGQADEVNDALSSVCAGRRLRQGKRPPRGGGVQGGWPGIRAISA